MKEGERKTETERQGGRERRGGIEERVYRGLSVVDPEGN